MLRINGNRLCEKLFEMAKIGATTKGGVCRVALTEQDKLGRDLFIKWCLEIDCVVDIDQLGNIFARRLGRNNAAPAVMIGSHLDSQPTGGKYDGVLGVLAGLEVLHTLHDANIVTDVPLEIVSWTNEEGARFSPAMVASGVFAGEFSLDFAYNREDKVGTKLLDALVEIGYKGKSEVGNRKYKATFELHIEQGPILEAAKKSVGIVTGVQGIRWYNLLLNGKETHAGPSPMSFRKDPMLTLSRLLPRIFELTKIHGPDAKVTVGYINAFPGVRNTVPGYLDISVDMRHPCEEILFKMHQDLTAIVNVEKHIDQDVGHLELVWYSPPVMFDTGCIEAVKKATEKLAIPSMEIVSGAGHDAVYISKVAPTSMIFIPCTDGLSHNELEHAEKVDIINGTNVLLAAVLEMANDCDLEFRN
ncbi:N-carbamoyl-L-amino-acid hydrolase [Gelidibacter algens]|jgi:N-carbamoyl-L-amino-acid hydrolase|uniref:N-carbamoyl-L-amino-acid hydrolase n=1 Tax=Gelidibacter algens TaxID=49280 RepID=A0A1A7R3A7_9FLAO|nr:Zn-dependent hydrolase [Gelidibacter algens]OBX25252.1 Zn-dependent hydrolase [Gelidibacter algens]RAJ20981.1 N-carbamoyl-L-amino-acid hydrolase [Gelidibacter algens]